MRVLVTGASGFLGRHVRLDLERAGHNVIPIGRGPDGALHNIDTGKADSLFDHAEAVVHLAGAVSQGPDTPVSDYLTPNVALAEQVLLRAAHSGATRFVFSSSRLVYRSDLGRPATEDDVPGPESAYGLSKLFAERVIAYQSSRVGIRATSLRISQLVGPGDGDRGVLARFATSALAGDPITVSGRGIAARDFLDVRDAARGVRLALEADETPTVLNVGGGAHTILELAGIAATALDPDTAIEHLPVDVEDTSHWSLDTTLAERSIGWLPQISLEDALRHRVPAV